MLFRPEPPHETSGKTPLTILHLSVKFIYALARGRKNPLAQPSMLQRTAGAGAYRLNQEFCNCITREY